MYFRKFNFYISFLFIISFPAISQENVDSTNGVTDLEEIVVTATSRESSVLDVPYNISTISGSDLEERAIQTRVVFTGNVLRQPMCKDINKRVRKEGYPNSDAVMERGVLLPVHHAPAPS